MHAVSVIGCGGVHLVWLALRYVGVHRVRLVLLYVCSCVSVLRMYCMRLASLGVGVCIWCG